MARLSQRRKDAKEKSLQDAIRYYNQSDEPSIRATAEKFGVAHTTLRDRRAGTQSHVISHRKMQAYTEYEEKAIVQWCKSHDEWRHPLRLDVVKGMAQCILHRQLKSRTLGRHWLTRFLNRNPGLAAKISTRIDRQRAFASNPAILKDFFRKVSFQPFSITATSSTTVLLAILSFANYIIHSYGDLSSFTGLLLKICIIWMRKDS